MSKFKLFIPIGLLVALFIFVLQGPRVEPFVSEKQYEIVEEDLFEEAVALIIKHEGWHSPKHYPYVGYGHKVTKGEKIDHTITHEEAVELVRSDLRKKCAVFREHGKDSLILGVLAYNVGEYKLINQDGSPKSTLVKKLKDGSRDIFDDYVSFRIAWGRVIPSIEKRRVLEYNTLFNKTNVRRRELN